MIKVRTNIPILWLSRAYSYGYKDVKDMLMDLYINDKMSYRQIAKKLGVSIWSINKVMVKEGIPRRTKGGNNNNIYSKIRKLYANNTEKSYKR